MKKQNTLKKTCLNPHYSFEEFIVGKGNKLAYEIAESVSKEPGKRYNPFFLYCGSGLGKTHLLHSIANRLNAEKPKLQVIYITCKEFLEDMIGHIRKNTLSEFEQTYSNADVLLIDNIEHLEGKPRTQEIFFHIFNSRYEVGHQVVLASNKPPNKLKALEERLKGRFRWGVIIEIKPLEYNTRLAILKSMAKKAKIELSEDVLQDIASNIKVDMGIYSGVLKKIYAVTSVTGKTMTLSSLKKLLKEYIE